VSIIWLTYAGDLTVVGQLNLGQPERRGGASGASTWVSRSEGRDVVEEGAADGSAACFSGFFFGELVAADGTPAVR
jgi:hypothetical protein